jgi:hypothetical protein
MADPRNLRRLSQQPAPEQGEALNTDAAPNKE